MEKVNNKLFDMYSKYWSNLESDLKNIDTINLKISYPLLINVFPEYLDSDVKVLVVGQQSCGWGLSKENEYFNVNDLNNPIENLMNLYKEFHLGKNYIKSPFWDATNYIYNKLNRNNSEYGFLYTNIVKVDQDGSRTQKSIEDSVTNSFPVVPLEIEILKPDVVVFFTGPDYEQNLKDTFKNIEFEEVESFSYKMLSRINHPMLPKHSYRTYHPGYLRRSKNYNKVLDKIVSLILEV